MLSSAVMNSAPLLCDVWLLWCRGNKKKRLSLHIILLCRCATGYHGNPRMPGGRCEECKCSSWGALPGPCDPVTGQCRCRVGASGISCDQCMERHVCGPSGIICKANTHFCFLSLCTFPPIMSFLLIQASMQIENYNEASNSSSNVAFYYKRKPLFSFSEILNLNHY